MPDDVLQCHVDQRGLQRMLLRCSRLPQLALDLSKVPDASVFWHIACVGWEPIGTSLLVSWERSNQGSYIYHNRKLKSHAARDITSSQVQQLSVSMCYKFLGYQGGRVLQIICT